MKRIFYLQLLLLVAIHSYAYDFQSGDLYYNITSSSVPYTVEVTNQDGWSSNNNYLGLTSAIIPETVTYNGTTYSVTSIGMGAFYRCDAITSISIGNNVTSIGHSAFTDCSNLASVTIGNSVTSIGSWAFESCTSLTSITIPNSVTSIGEGVFRHSPSLTSMVVESGNTTYDSRKNCNAIIETATNTLIAGCQNTVIPNSVNSIGNRAFDYCQSLAAITIPSSVTCIGSSAFASCSSLTSVTIGNSVTSIGEWAFSFCYSLTNVTIGNSVTSIGNRAFANCRFLISVICEAIEVPEVGTNTFSGVPLSVAKLYVPAESIDDYKAVDQWKDFNKILANDFIFQSLISVTDGTLEDWKNLPTEYIASCTCPENASNNGLLSMKVYADETYINLAVEYNPEVVTNLSSVLCHIFIDTDNSSMTGGASDLYTNGSIDLMLVTSNFTEDNLYRYNPAVFWWWGKVGGEGWLWTDPNQEVTPTNCGGAIVCEGSLPIGNSQLVGNTFEIQLQRELIPAPDNAPWGNTFRIGVDIWQLWTNVGILPVNTAIPLQVIIDKNKEGTITDLRHTLSSIYGTKKLLHNGQLLILRDNKTYNIMGQEL